MTHTYISHEIAPSGRVDPDKSYLLCEAPGCTNPTPLLVGTAYSFHFRVEFATVGPDRRIGSFTCDDEQHFGCSPACALAAAIMCMRDHLIPAHAAKIADANVQAAAQAAIIAAATTPEPARLEPMGFQLTGTVLDPTPAGDAARAAYALSRMPEDAQPTVDTPVLVADASTVEDAPVEAVAPPTGAPSDGVAEPTPEPPSDTPDDTPSPEPAPSEPSPEPVVDPTPAPEPAVESTPTNG